MELPTETQVDEFIHHIWNVHSWYKHISLIRGARFVVFLSSDSGVNYPSKHPALKFGNNVEGYRKQFGHLDYAYSYDNQIFHRDGTVMLSREEIDSIAIRDEFVLYPYVHSEIYWSVHKEDLTRIKDGAEHPHSKKLIELQELELECVFLGEDMPEDDFDYCLDVIEGDEEYESGKNIHPMAHCYILKKQRQFEIWESLQSLERIKVKLSLNKLMVQLENA